MNNGRRLRRSEYDPKASEKNKDQRPKKRRVNKKRDRQNIKNTLADPENSDWEELMDD